MQHIMASFHHHDMFDIWQLFNGHTPLIALLLTFLQENNYTQVHNGTMIGNRRTSTIEQKEMINSLKALCKRLKVHTKLNFQVGL